MTPENVFGYCDRCEKYHSLPQGKARQKGEELLQSLQNEGCLDFELPRHLRRREYSTDSLYGPHRGKMFGVLHCVDQSGQEQFLKAFSCQHKGEWSVPGWVPPIVDGARYLEKVRSGGNDISRLTKLLHHEDTPLIRQKLKTERRRISQALMEELFEMYELMNFRGEKKSLREVFRGSGGIPTGTGDCCAPKLLHHAAVIGAHPLGIAEFYLGRETPSSNKKEGRFYPACKERCQPILGFLLCGIE
ncbi:hypothetical protein [Chitinivibrio alkaliphilus]|uniref:Uncharacterized protein n=1 Tax=Chitinivibrio alkaliphilus ACht1 TaxID=1313304 RepID=U7DB34_9BACT|nr:hypothetical protein [Chitinivibrio alkaliphilus]ERP39242.1 hypothetical protein CALK_0030 [Chitinivibrio alkaliphilus ACht1]